ncbi:MAG: hypothetical protein ACTSWW_00605, partial [Promethearchaeota archaeon]
MVSWKYSIKKPTSASKHKFNNYIFFISFLLLSTGSAMKNLNDDFISNREMWTMQIDEQFNDVDTLLQLHFNQTRQSLNILAQS